MQVMIEVHETAKRKPTQKDAIQGCVIARSMTVRDYDFEMVENVRNDPEEYSLWFSLRGLPKPPLHSFKRNHDTN